MGESILGEIIGLLTGGITGIAEGIGGGLQSLAESIFLTTTGTGESAVTKLSVFGTLIVVFAGISLAVGLSKLIVRWLSTLGGSRV